MKARVAVDGRRRVAKISPLIYGHFLEHFHRCVYGGIFDPGSTLADERGFRRDVLAALRRIRTPLLRWPGGCYADGYHWKNGIGASGGRPLCYDYHWHQEETNQFGTNEFIELCRQVGAEPYICANAGTGTAEEAAQWVEYCNTKGRTRYARLREEHGYEHPHRVTYWGIGNELNGDWEIGGPMSGTEYGKRFRDFARLMKNVDPNLKLVAVGSRDDNEFNSDFLKEAGDLADYFSMHYYCYRTQTLPDYYGAVATPSDAEAKLQRLIRTLQFPNALLPRETDVKIAVDEWNPWAWSHLRKRVENHRHRAWGDWDPGSLAENDANDRHTIREAIVTARFLHVFHRNSQHVRIANFSPVVNVRGAIYVHPNGLVLRPQYHVFDVYANHFQGLAIDSRVEAPTYDARVTKRDEPDRTVEIGNVPYLDCSASLDEEAGRLCLSLVNLHLERQIEAEISLQDVDVGETAEAFEINASSAEAFNDAAHPNDVAVCRKELAPCAAAFSYSCPPHSITVLAMRLKNA